MGRGGPPGGRRYQMSFPAASTPTCPVSVHVDGNSAVPPGFFWASGRWSLFGSCGFLSVAESLFMESVFRLSEYVRVRSARIRDESPFEAKQERGKMTGVWLPRVDTKPRLTCSVGMVVYFECVRSSGVNRF